LGVLPRLLLPARGGLRRLIAGLLPGLRVLPWLLRRLIAGLLPALGVLLRRHVVLLPALGVLLPRHIVLLLPALWVLPWLLLPARGVLPGLLPALGVLLRRHVVLLPGLLQGLLPETGTQNSAASGTDLIVITIHFTAVVTNHCYPPKPK